jgi:Ras-related protein Rab-8A
MSRSKKKEESYDYLVKLIIIGDSGVGKTNILMKFCEQEFKSSYVATIGVDFKIKTIQVEDKRFKLQIWDTAGQERFKNITQTYYKGAVGIILAYSVIEESTFDNIGIWLANVEKWISQINDSTNTDVRKILIANKTDLASERKITPEQGERLARKYNMPYL